MDRIRVMKKFKFIKQSLGLTPFDSEAEEALKKWGTGDFIEVAISRPRNSLFHRKFFAMLNVIYENTEEFKTLDNLLAYIKIQTGWADIVEANGLAFRVPKSIAFAKMNQDDFDTFYNNAVDECLKLVPIDKEDLAREIAQF